VLGLITGHSYDKRSSAAAAPPKQPRLTHKPAHAGD
jgi:hypothetical protein